jgi:hypothetical protein
MISPQRSASNPLATILILSAIDVLLCSFTAGVALFLMGDSGIQQRGDVHGAGLLDKDYLYIEVLGASMNESVFGIAGTPFRFVWAGVRDKPPIGVLRLQSHAEAGCTAKDDGAALWIVECDARDETDWFASVETSQPVSVRITTVTGPESRFCRANLTPGNGVRIFGEQPELRLASQPLVSPAKEIAATEGKVQFYCDSGPRQQVAQR